MLTHHADIAIVGAGIAGLAHALAAARRGWRVVVFERHERAVGASVRNFGLVWPIGVPLGPRYARALRGRERWLDAAKGAGFGCEANGALLLAYHSDEWAVLSEFWERERHERPQLERLTPAEALARSPAARPDGLLGALGSGTELTVDPRKALRALPAWLARDFGVQFCFGTPVSAIAFPHIETPTQRWRVAHIVVCGGANIETLYPDLWATSGLTRCKLQMMRTEPQPDGWRLGPTLAAGLTVARYDAFAGCPTLPALQARLASALPDHLRYGIHVMLAQNGAGELVIGDSHEYGHTVEPFDRADIDRLILEYLATFARVPSLRIAERWHGVYLKRAGAAELVAQPEPGVTVACDTGGLGMTLSFGLADEVIAAL